jgi:hypothetical protein
MIDVQIGAVITNPYLYSNLKVSTLPSMKQHVITMIIGGTPAPQLPFVLTFSRPSYTKRPMKTPILRDALKRSAQH